MSRSCAADDRIGFQHPAFREVVYAELLPGERRRLHRAAAEALTAESAAEPEVVGEIARHWHLAGDLPRALDSSVAAGHAYERLYAFADARDSYLRALDLLPAVPNELDAVDLRTRAGECASLSGDYAAAIGLIGEALAGSTAPAQRAALLQRLGSCHFLAGDGPAAESAFREALGLLPPGETSTLAARLHAGVALLAVAWSRLDEAEAACAEALRISRAIGARREEGLALNAQALVLATRGDLAGGRAAAAGVAGHRPRDRAAPRPGVGVREPVPRAGARGAGRRRPDPRAHRDRGAEPLRAGPPERQPAALQHRRHAAQVGSGRRGRGADRRGAGPAPARDHGGPGAARGCPLEPDPGRPHHGLGAL